MNGLAPRWLAPIVSCHVVVARICCQTDFSVLSVHASLCQSEEKQDTSARDTELQQRQIKHNVEMLVPNESRDGSTIYGVNIGHQRCRSLIREMLACSLKCFDKRITQFQRQGNTIIIRFIITVVMFVKIIAWFVTRQQ